MIGLIILLIAAVYLALLIWATRAAYRWAKRRGFSNRRCFAVAAIAFLAIYLPVFWDHIPTVVAHKYYCTKEAGVWIYKSLDQWKKEHPNAAMSLTSQGISRKVHDPQTGSYTTHLNERFIHVVTYRRFLIPVSISTELVIDRVSGETLAKHVGVGTGYGNWMVGGDPRSLKFWLSQEPCDGESMPSRKQYEAFVLAAKKLGEKQ